MLWRYWKWEEAEAELRRAIELDPEYAEGYRVYGMLLLMTRRIEEAVAALNRACELDRLSPIIHVEYGGALLLAGRDDEALRQYLLARELNPNFSRSYQGVAFLRAKRGDWNGAIEALEEDPAYPLERPAYPWLGFYYAAAGRRAEALQVLKNIEADVEDEHSRTLSLGIVHLGLGDKRKALDCIETGIKGVRSDLTVTTVLYDLLKDEPRYQALLSEMGLPVSG